jgi:hypothetical protein
MPVLKSLSFTAIPKTGTIRSRLAVYPLDMIEAIRG